MKTYLKGFISYCSNRINLTLVLVAGLLIALGGIFYWVITERNEKVFVEHNLKRQQVIARVGAESIGNFFKLVAKSISLLPDNPLVYSFDKKTQEVLDEFCLEELFNAPIAGVILVDKNGVIRFSSERSGRLEEGIDMSDRDYFIWARKAKENEIFLGEPVISRLGASKGQFLVTITTPLFDKGEFNGIVTAGVLLSELTKTYLEPLKTSADTQVYLISSDGLFLHSPIPELVGENLFEYLDKNRYPGSEAVIKKVRQSFAQAEKERGGTLEFISPDLKDKKILTRNLLGYSSVYPEGIEQEGVATKRWFLAISDPLDKTSTSYLLLQMNERMFLGLVVFITITFSTFAVLAIRITQTNSYQNGFNHGKNHRKAS